MPDPIITSQTIFQQLTDIAASQEAGDQIVSLTTKRGLVAGGKQFLRADVIFHAGSSEPEFKQNIVRQLIRSLASRVGADKAKQLVAKNLTKGNTVVFVSELRSLLADLTKIDASDSALKALHQKSGQPIANIVSLNGGFLEIPTTVRNILKEHQFSEASLRGLISDAAKLLQDVPFATDAATKASMQALMLRESLGDYVKALNNKDLPECNDLCQRLTTLQQDLTDYKNSLCEQMAQGAETKENLKLVIKMRYGAALDVLADAVQNNPKLASTIKSLRQEMLAKIQMLTRGSASKEMVAELKALPALLQKRLANVLTNVDKDGVKALYQQAFKKLLNKAPWDTISRDVSLYDEKQGQVTVRSEMTPARLIGIGNALEKDAVNGVNSSDSSSSHIVNLWRSEASRKKPDGTNEVLFSGLRHGVLDAYGIKKNEAARSAANLNRAKELLTAALTIQPELLNRACQGEVVELPVLSVSLLAPNLVTPSEKKMLPRHMAALNTMNNHMVKLTVNGIEVRVTPRIMAFNYGVDKFSKSYFLGADTNSNVYNNPAMEWLLGNPKSWRTKARGNDGSEFGGLVGNWLARNANTPTAVKIRHLAQQVADLQESGRYRTRLADPYAIPARLLLIAHLMGITPAYNCKSGKDRTGQLDVAVKTLAYQMSKAPVETMTQMNMAEARRIFDQFVPNPMKKATPAQLHEMNRFAVNAGNMEIQRLNTGVAGSKTANYWAYSDGLRNQFRKDAYDYYKGLSKLAKT